MNQTESGQVSMGIITKVTDDNDYLRGEATEYFEAIENKKQIEK